MYEKTEDRTFFGFPAKCEGPGPSKYIPNSNLAFRSISQCEIIDKNPSLTNFGTSERF